MGGEGRGQGASRAGGKNVAATDKCGEWAESVREGREESRVTSAGPCRARWDEGECFRACALEPDGSESKPTSAMYYL